MPIIRIIVLTLHLVSSTQASAMGRATPSWADQLPPEVRSAAQAELKSIDLTEAGLTARPSLTFVSAESSAHNAEKVVNRIHRVESERFDVWLMRQRQFAVEGTDPAHWSLVAIIVDKAPKDGGASISYYLEFSPEPVVKGALPKLIEPRVPCFRCHPNGARAIRPRTSELVPALSETEHKLLAQWNTSIAKSGMVRAHMPKGTSAAWRYVGNKEMMEPLLLPKCRQCHAPDSGIRSELLRLHATSISFLAGHGDQATGYTAKAGGTVDLLPLGDMIPPVAGLAPAMPLEDEPLTATEIACLRDWYSGKPLASSCLAPLPRFRPSAPQRSKTSPQNSDAVRFEIDQTSSFLTAAVSTTFTRFSVADLRPQGEVLCESDCIATLSLAIDEATTGSSLRDTHMKRQVFDTEHFPRLAATSAKFPLPVLAHVPTSLRLRLTLSVKDVNAPIDVALLCQATAHDRVACDVAPFDWDLRDHGIEPPSFLSLAVSPKVRIGGWLELQRRFQR